MTIISFSHLRWQNRILAFCLLSIFSFIPIQHRFKGIMHSLSKSLIPSDLSLPSYFSKSIHLYLTDPFLLILIALLFYLRTPLRSFFWEGPSKILSLLFLTCFASLFFSTTAHYPLHYIKLLHVSLSFLLFNALVTLRHRLPSLPILFSLALTLGGLLESLLALFQYFHQAPVGLSLLGELDLSRFAFPNLSKQLWLFAPITDAEKLFRASGTFSHPNILGAFLFSSLFTTYHLYLNTTKRFFLITLFPQVAALCVCFSRSAMIAFFLATLFFSYKLFRQRHPKIFPLLITLLSALLVSLLLFLPPLIARGGLFYPTQTTQGADSERIQYMKMALEMIKEHPLLGVGFNHFQLVSTPFYETMPGHFFHSKVHNIYLLIAAETGLIGCALFLWFLFKILRASASLVFLSCFLGLLFIGCCDFFLLDTSPGRLLFFSIAALLYKKTA